MREVFKTSEFRKNVKLLARTLIPPPKGMRFTVR